MLRTLLVCLMVFMTLLCAYMLYLKATEDPLPDSKLSEYRKQLAEASQKQPITELPAVVKEINEKIAKVKSFSCPNLDMKIWVNGHRYKLHGSLYYEKPQRFRAHIHSLFGKEVDIGSNEKVFWYWSRRDRVPGLYYAKHEDVAKTGLKNPFNPVFVKATLGLDELSDKECKVVEKGDEIMLVYPRKNASGKPLLFSVMLNKSRKQIDGYILTNDKGVTLATCEIQEYSGNIPTKVLYNWYEENKVVLMVFIRPQENATINQGQWEMPNYSPKHNMAEGM
jgi:hypothetical protein